MDVRNPIDFPVKLLYAKFAGDRTYRQPGVRIRRSMLFDEIRGGCQGLPRIVGQEY